MAHAVQCNSTGGTFCDDVLVNTAICQAYCVFHECVGWKLVGGGASQPHKPDQLHLTHGFALSVSELHRAAQNCSGLTHPWR